MVFGHLRISRRSITGAIALAGLVSVVIGAHAALNKRSLDAAKAIASDQGAFDQGETITSTSRTSSPLLKSVTDIL